MLRRIIGNRGASLRNSIRSMREHFTPAHKKKISGLCALIFISAVLDVFGLASILPVITAATKPELIHSNAALQSVFTALNFADERTFLLFLILVLLVFFILKSAFGLFVSFLQIKISSDIAIHLSKNQFSKYFSLNYFDFQSLQTSVMTKDIVTDANTYVQWIVISIITLISELMIVLLIIGGIALYNIKLFGFIVLTVGPATVFISRIIRRKTSEIGVGIDTNFPKSMGAVMEALNGYIDIKLADKISFYRDKYLNYQYRFQWFMMKNYFMSQVPFRTNEIVALLGIIVIFVYALYFSGGEEVITLIGLFAAASYRLMPSVNRIVNSLNYLGVNQTSIYNLNNYLDNYHEELKKQTAQVPVGFENEIEFKKISFRFREATRPVLNKISLKIKKGEKTGFVGSSGSGKTTLMNILLRFYEEDSGEILVDGVKLSYENIVSWRKKIGYVKQDIFMLDGTIKENIAFGENKVDDEKLLQSIIQSSLSDFVNSLPEGVETRVGEKGSRLSGGQKQRIGIARSLYRDADILVFDEATSALDMQTENEVTEAIEKLSSTNKTIFIIAHRITTLKNCDKIIELKNGEIAGVHSYHELIEKIF